VVYYLAAGALAREATRESIKVWMNGERLRGLSENCAPIFSHRESNPSAILIVEYHCLKGREMFKR
jgi:hypothetical protein